MRYADPRTCPDCRRPLPVATPAQCPHCALPLHGDAAAALFATLGTADRQLTQLRAMAAGGPVPSTPGKPERPAVAPPVPSPGAPPLQAPVIPAPPRRGLSGASVPQVLLGLGALCVLVAAVTFLVVAWSWLGIGGRTAVLVGLTVLAAGVAVWVTRRGLRIGGEAFATIAVGLVALDVAGAADAGWLGQLGGAGTATACGVGATLAALGLVVGTRPRPLAAPQVLAPVALVLATVGGHGAVEDRHGLVGLLFTVAFLAVAWVGRQLPTPLLTWAAASGGLVAWCSLLVSGFDAPLTVRHLWLGAASWPLFAAGLVLLAAPYAVSPHPLVRLATTSVAGTVLTVAVALPALDESATRAISACLAAAAVWVGVLLLAPAFWQRVALLPASGLLLAPVAFSFDLSSRLMARAVGPAPFSREATDRLGTFGDPSGHPLLILGTAVVLALLVVGLAAWAFRREDVVRHGWAPFAAVVVAAAVATLTAYDVPRLLVTLPLAALAAVLVIRPGAVSGQVPAAALAPAALVLALPSAGLTALVLGLVVAACLAVVAWRPADPGTWGPEGALPLAAGGLAWTIGHLLSIDPQWRGLLVIAAVAVLAWWRPRPVLEGAAAVAAVVGLLASVDASAADLTVLAVHLTLFGAVLVAHALIHPSRRRVAYAGGALLAMATWARLADIGVEQPEAYTMPTALALVALGLWHLRRHPSASTYPTLVPGLSLATVPTLLWALDDPLSWRAVLLGAACLALVVGATVLRWSGPLVVGAVVGAILVLRELQPYSSLVPPWVLIGVAGATLITVGLTWESRMNDLRRGAAYLAALR